QQHWLLAGPFWAGARPGAGAGAGDPPRGRGFGRKRSLAMMAPMQRDDVPAVAALFYRAFRGGGAPSAAFQTYLERSFFTAPGHDPAVASMVHRDGDGFIDAALLVIPMQVRIGDRVLTGRLMSNYMTDPRQPTRGGANMVLTLRS